MPNADRYVQISNFKWGLDSRRSELLDQPGALIQVDNAHINQGGEIEQRKSFAKQTGVASANTFGFETTATGIVRFGSALVGVVTLPTGMVYRRCDHPTGFKIGGAAVTMTGVLASTNFNGNAFVLTTWDDGNIFAYYGDVSPMPLVAQITRDGNVLYIASGPEALSNLAVDLNTILSAITGFHPSANVDEKGNAINGDLTLLTDPGVHLAFVPTVVSASGQLQAKLIDANIATVNLQAAAATFFLSSGAGGSVTLTAPATIGGTGTAQLTGGAISYDTSLAKTAGNVVSAVNALTSVTGYTAVLTGVSGIIIYAPQAWGNFTFNLTITLVTLGTATSGNPLMALIQFNGVAISNISFAPNSPRTQTSTVNVAVTGLTGAGTYTWIYIPGASDNIIPVISPSGSSCSITAPEGSTLFIYHLNGVLTCVVKDGPTGAMVTTSITVTAPT